MEKIINKFPNGNIFHVFNKSIASFGIFKDLNNAERFLNILSYYNDSTIVMSYSDYLRRKKYSINNLFCSGKVNYIKLLSYCIMPDHYHLLVKILKDNIFSKYIGRIENSFTRFFNLKFERKGPLWQSRFKSVLIENNEQLLHVSRYIHLNPTTSELVEKPENWQYSSYRFLILNDNLKKVKEISITNPFSYRKFVEGNQDYQKKLKKLKKVMLD